MRPIGAQQEQEELEQKPNGQKLKALLRANDADSSRPVSSKGGSLVERVMKRHGFTREEALQEIEKFGG